ncbi:hypothetical protein M9H77_02189 [Catharanthus roseus]|uniref:Uncharacterized protein n=1 Tax=Catharanthus roseus TaxID=4058 RepID=A0ACC0C7P4_CATRO|nr:hypothetical protein M9H77_02189 [Catharanthus roseus]
MVGLAVPLVVGSKPRENVNAISVTINEEIPTTKKEGMIIEEGSCTEVERRSSEKMGKKEEHKGKWKSTSASYKPKIPFLDTLVRDRNQDEMREFLKIFGQLKINLPLCDLLLPVPKNPIEKGKEKPKKKHRKNGRQITSKLKASSMKWVSLRRIEEKKQTKHCDVCDPGECASLAAQKWVANRESLKIVIEKSFDVPVIEHFNLEHLFERWVGYLFFAFLVQFYPNLVREFSANMLYRTDKGLETIISTIKGVRIILTRERLASILAIPDEGTIVTMDLNKKTIDENLGYSYDAACNRFDIQPRPIDRLHGGDFPLFFLMPLLISSSTLLFKRAAGKVMFAFLTSIFLISFTIAPLSLSLAWLCTQWVVLGVTIPKPMCIITL